MIKIINIVRNVAFKKLLVYGIVAAAAALGIGSIVNPEVAEIVAEIVAALAIAALEEAISS